LLSLMARLFAQHPRPLSTVGGVLGTNPAPLHRWQGPAPQYAQCLCPLHIEHRCAGKYARHTFATILRTSGIVINASSRDSRNAFSHL
jgi:hypothetical protein